jgi:arginyl-tRNA synthetase
MPDPRGPLSDALTAAVERAFGPEFAGVDPVVRPGTNPAFGDYQANVALALAKRLDRPPREVATAIYDAMDWAGLCSRVEVAGPGFINMWLDDAWLAARVGELLGDERGGAVDASVKQTVVIDYSGPNVARELHVGHLRSTVIGDSLARVLAFLGHDVVRQNHLGDWGTQFGMLIEYLVDSGWARSTDHHIGDLNVLYKQAQDRFAAEPEFAERARQRVVLLQGGDPATLAVWRELVEESERHFGEVYKRLGILLTPEDDRGESFYNDQLPGVADELIEKGLAVVDDGALCVFPPGFVTRDGQPLPLIIRKTDGGYPYAATDLAAVRYRRRVLGGERLVYVVDARQAQHFSMVFTVARMAGWLAEGDRVEHVPFGTILGTDGRPFRMRAGGTVKLAEVLDEAVDRATAIIEEKSPELDATLTQAAAHTVGIGAIKYADLSSDRIKDYRFDLDRMLSFDGNTAAYLQYAYVRIRSIFRRAEVAVDSADAAALTLTVPQERALALALLEFRPAVASVGETLQPHKLCTYLFDLAQAFTAFFEHCPVLRAESPSVQRSRLVLCEITAGTLQTGLDLLGIETVEQM